MPIFHYHLPGTPQPLSAVADAWNTPLPLDRHSAQRPSPEKTGSDLTQGDYFTAARHFLEANGFATLIGAVTGRRGQPALLEDLREIHITLIKHGAFYHPALISVHGLGEPLNFVLNAAVSEPGRQTIENEYAALKRLTKTGAGAHVPAVYGRGTVQTNTGRPLDMFLGDWFDEFHEFHLSRQTSSSPLKLRVWNNERGGFFLTENQTCELYRQASFILTACYNPLTFEQIFPWHHAAGDFVVRVDTTGITTRLITVRQYGPMFRDTEILQNAADQQKQTMLGLLLSLLNLSIRMRIDRLDGTGELVFSGDEAVLPVWEGFISGLQQSYSPWPFRENMASAFKTYLAGISVSKVYDLAQAAAGGFHPRTPERALIDPHLVDHVATLWTTIEHFGLA
jgi:hypothetical protein